MQGQILKTIICTLLAVIGFAGNSVLCRLALGEETIDASSFTIIRLLSGITVLMLMVALTNKQTNTTTKGSWAAAMALFIYAVSFSYAYISLNTGIGALVLFGSVQISMVVASVLSGHKPSVLEILGISIAFSGLIYLLSPSLSSSSFSGFVLMTFAGIAWAFYTLKGRGSTNPLSDTAYNFLRTLPLVMVLLLLTIHKAQLSQEGIFFAVMSGAICSGVAYTIWYVALPNLSLTQAAVTQLFAPIIAAIGGVIFNHETFTLQLTIAACLVLGGILLVVLAQASSHKSK